jgi:zeaxanthin glucosyltransferase
LANILIGARPLTAHIMQMFRLANDLENRGHAVTYVVSDIRFKPFIESQGFDFYHLRLLDGFHDGESSIMLENLIPPIREIRRLRRGARAVCQALLDGSVHRSMVETIAPDLVIIDSSAIKYALPLLAWNIPVVMVSPTLPSDYGDNVPHTHSHFIPTSSRLSRYRCKFEWMRNRLIRQAKTKLGLSEYSDCRAVAEHHGLRFSQLLERQWLSVRLKLPMLILCPTAFDFPRPPRPNRYFLDAGVWPDYREDTASREFPWHRIEPNIPLVYCALGTRIPDSPQWRVEAGKTLRKIIKDFSNQNQFQLVISVGASFETSAVSSVPDNVIIINKWIPQMKVLRQAAVHITHAGFTSVRESIECEVPMIAIPFDADQPGNAARVVYHNLGIRVFPRNAFTVDLLELTKQVCASPTYRENLRRMRLEFDRQRAKQSAADLIESLLY